MINVSLLMFSVVKQSKIIHIMPDASSDIPHSTVLYSLIHTAVRGTANVNSGTAFISDHIIPSIQYSTLVMMSV